MAQHDALLLDESLREGDVSLAWLVWSGAAGTALADASRFFGGLVPTGAWFSIVVVPCQVVRLGGHEVRKARGNVADAHDDVFRLNSLLNGRGCWSFVSCHSW